VERGKGKWKEVRESRKEYGKGVRGKGKWKVERDKGKWKGVARGCCNCLLSVKCWLSIFGIETV
jgi:hypothetical protein